MFAVRGVAISFSIFVILYVAFSALVCFVWRGIWHYAERRPPRRCADLLFALRLAPFVLASVATLFFAVPSFLWLEPRSGSEPVGFVAWLLGISGAAVLAAGVGKAAASWVRASRMIARWSL